MNDIKVPVEVDPTEDTEWNDILRDHGIIPERPKSPTEELEQALEAVVRKQHENRLVNKSLAELNDLEDEEDDEFLQEYKIKRYQELQNLQSRARFGSVQHITKPEYEEEVTQTSENHFVMVHMSLQSQVQSRLLSSLMVTMAQKFPEIKFAEIPATRCVDNYPESNCPTIIVYHKKNIVRQFVTLTQLGGNHCNLFDLESIFVNIGALKYSDERLEENLQNEDLEETRRLRFVKRSIRNIESNDSDDFDEFD